MLKINQLCASSHRIVGRQLDSGSGMDNNSKVLIIFFFNRNVGHRQ